MSGLGTAYLVGCLALVLCTVAAWVLITTLNHLDPPGRH